MRAMESRPTVMTQKIYPRAILEIRARILSSVLEQRCFILKFSMWVRLGLRRLRIAIAIIETGSWGIYDFCQNRSGRWNYEIHKVVSS